MSKKEIRERVDLTNLSVTATKEDINKLCRKALNYNTASVCVAPCWIKHIAENFPGLTICTVIGFPNGYNSTKVKVYEAEQAILDGASEIDMVINQRIAHSTDKNDWDYTINDIAEVRRATQGKAVLKVIFETCNLGIETIQELSSACVDLKVDYVKTSTGFGKEGATPENVKAMVRETKKSSTKVKAAGGIRTYNDADMYINKLRCDRIGASSPDIIGIEVGEKIHLTKCEGKEVDITAEVTFVEGSTINAKVIGGEYDKEYVTAYDYLDSFTIIY